MTCLLCKQRCGANFCPEPQNSGDYLTEALWTADDVPRVVVTSPLPKLANRGFHQLPG